MPQIDETLFPRFGRDNLVAVAVNAGRKTEFATTSFLDYELSFAVALDAESEVFRSYRMPALVFPLHVIVDRQGKIAFVGTGDLKETETAIAAALE